MSFCRGLNYKIWRFYKKFLQENFNTSILCIIYAFFKQKMCFSLTLISAALKLFKSNVHCLFVLSLYSSE